MAATMKFDEFQDKLVQLKKEYTEETGKELETIIELESYLKKRKYRVKGRRNLVSLKGFNF